MIKKNIPALITLLLLPLSALAHGEEIIYTLLSQVVLLIIVFILIGILKWKLKGKLILLALYFLSIFITELSMSKFPYFQNEILITTLLLIIPAVITCFGYFILKGKFQKSAEK